ncbi:MAG: beta-ketoacyl-ACP synthase II [Candidatus Delongbacteria bacterium]|nr:beta-ketoacyl-ACP synthase II [Candidatus Delongbacteria bacterium]MBN2836552.1 beta-ketoacyl-ACP synthase II [Candidatus Delongbacteria bacterium]
MKRRVVVTGLGVVSTLGYDTETFYSNLLAGKNGISLIERFDTTEFSTKIAGEIKDFKAEDYFERNEAKRMDRFCQFAVVAATKAMEDSKIDLDKVDRDRFGVISASGIGGMETFMANQDLLRSKGPRRISPLFIPMMILDIAAGRISIKFDLRGPNYSTVSACASSGHAIGNAFRTIQYGDADYMIAGGSESVITELAIGGFGNMKAISSRNDSPETASRPFDVDRDGFVMGEGSAFLVLEEYEHAVARGAKIYAEIAGIGYSADAKDIVAPDETGNGAMRAMKAALNDAGVSPEQIDHINTHGTSTPLGDIAETKAVKALFGDHAYKIAVNSTKSMIGHLLGAAGAIETLATIKAIETGKVHPTINIFNQDPECDLDYTIGKYREMDVKYAISNVFGFGGHNCSILVKKV